MTEQPPDRLEVDLDPSEGVTARMRPRFLRAVAAVGAVGLVVTVSSIATAAGIFEFAHGRLYDAGEYETGTALAEEAGYQDGHSDGFESGQSAGEADGFETGYDEGYSDGERNGRRDGYADGERAGWLDGAIAGYSDGCWAVFQAAGDTRVVSYLAWQFNDQFATVVSRSSC